MNLPPIMTADGRKAWAFLALVGGSAVNTVFAAVVLYLVHERVGLAFWLGIVAQAQVLVILTALGALLVKRSVKVSRDSIEISDQADAAAQFVADAGQSAADEVKE
jgi:hypothetical protein